ncbi:cohesin domain-containing protein [bacterium]|nr:cohesin domain-containing protein [bacterium]
MSDDRRTPGTFIVFLPVLTLLCLFISGCLSVQDDTEKPSNPRITLNNNESQTYEQTVSLNLFCDDNDLVEEMMISNSPDFEGAEWVPYEKTMTWALTDGFGSKTVYVRFRDTAMNVSDIASMTIAFKPEPSTLPADPVVLINSGNAYTKTLSVRLDLSCVDDKGITAMRISDHPDFSGASWESYDTSKTWTLPDGAGMKTVYVQFIDGDGNMSDPVSAAIEYYENAILNISPANAFVNIGGTIDIDIFVRGAVQIISTYMTLSFDPARVEVTKITTSGSGFLLTEAGANVITAENVYNNNTGKIIFGVLGQKSGFTGATGDGTIARITFKGKEAGESHIQFVSSTDNDFLLYGYAANDNGFEKCAATRFDGVITVK